MGKFVVLLCAVLIVCLSACGGETDTVEETSPAKVVDIEEPATSTTLLTPWLW